jgi:putative ATPase
VPLHLRDAHYSGASQLGHTGYKYPHDYPNHYVAQQYLPDPIGHEHIYEASDQGMEDKIRINQTKRLEQSKG